jgi:putative tricarboxylic transport membrane protein
VPTHPFISKDRVGGCLLGLFCLSYGILGQDIQLIPAQTNAAFHARSLPDFLALSGVILSAWLVLFPSNHEAPGLRTLNWKRLLFFLSLMSLYGYTLRPLGFLLSTSLFLMGGFLGLGERGPFKVVGVAVGVTLLFWGVMTFGLGIFIDPFPALLALLAQDKTAG